MPSSFVTQMCQWLKVNLVTISSYEPLHLSHDNLSAHNKYVGKTERTKTWNKVDCVGHYFQFFFSQSQFHRHCMHLIRRQRNERWTQRIMKKFFFSAIPNSYSRFIFHGLLYVFKCRAQPQFMNLSKFFCLLI